MTESEWQQQVLRSAHTNRRQNEAAERLRLGLRHADLSSVDAKDLLDAALAEERRHVIEQIRERFHDRLSHGQDAYNATTRILDELSND